MKKLITILSIISSCFVGKATNITNYPVVTTISGDQYILLSSVINQTNYNITWQAFTNLLNSYYFQQAAPSNVLNALFTSTNISYTYTTNANGSITVTEILTNLSSGLNAGTNIFGSGAMTYFSSLGGQAGYTNVSAVNNVIFNWATAFPTTNYVVHATWLNGPFTNAITCSNQTVSSVQLLFPTSTGKIEVSGTQNTQ